MEQKANQYRAASTLSRIGSGEEDPLRFHMTFTTFVTFAPFAAGEDFRVTS